MGGYEKRVGRNFFQQCRKVKICTLLHANEFLQCNYEKMLEFEKCKVTYCYTKAFVSSLVPKVKK